MFIDVILEHGVPSRVHGDRGGENRDVSIMMILLRGLDRASFMWGSSVFNTRIEHLWVEVGQQFARAWRAFSDDWSVFTFWTKAILTIYGFCISFS